MVDTLDASAVSTALVSLPAVPVPVHSVDQTTAVRNAMNLPRDVVFSDKWNNVYEVFAHVDEGNLQEVIWHHCCIVPNIDIDFLDEVVNEWCVERDACNDRGEQSVIDERQASCETVGVIDGLRMGGVALPKGPVERHQVRRGSSKCLVCTVSRYRDHLLLFQFYIMGVNC